MRLLLLVSAPGGPSTPAPSGGRPPRCTPARHRRTTEKFAPPLPRWWNTRLASGRGSPSGSSERPSNGCANQHAVPCEQQVTRPCEDGARLPLVDELRRRTRRARRRRPGSGPGPRRTKYRNRSPSGRKLGKRRSSSSGALRSSASCGLPPAVGDPVEGPSLGKHDHSVGAPRRSPPGGIRDIAQHLDGAAVHGDRAQLVIRDEADETTIRTTRRPPTALPVPGSSRAAAERELTDPHGSIDRCSRGPGRRSGNHPATPPPPRHSRHDQRALVLRQHDRAQDWLGPRSVLATRQPGKDGEGGQNGARTSSRKPTRQPPPPAGRWR